MDVIGSALNNIRNAAGQLFGNIGNAVGNEIHQLPQQVQSTANNLNFDFWHSPVGQGLVNLQKSTPAYQQGGMNAFGIGNFLNNNQGIQNYVPQFQPQHMNNPIGQTVANVGAGI